MSEVYSWDTIVEFVQVGTVGKTTGAHGEVKLHLYDHYFEIAVNSRFLFVDIDGSKVPFEIEQLRSSRGLNVKFISIDDASQALKLVSGAVYMPKDKVGTPVDAVPSDLVYFKLIGYVVEDANLGTLGSVHDVKAYPQQEMAVLLYQGEEVLVPLNPTFVQRIDDEAHVVHVDLPEGLLDQF